MLPIAGLVLTLMAVASSLVKGQSHNVLYPGQISPNSNQDISIVKCFFVVYGEFTFDQAESACQLRNATLAIFSTKTEQRLVRRRIDWANMPGFEMVQSDKKEWLGQLWIGARRKSNGSQDWLWHTPFYQGNVLKTSLDWQPDNPYDETTAAPSSDQDCAVLRAKGWAPLSCEGTESGDKAAAAAGALCNFVARTSPTSDATTNFCSVPLMPYSTSNLALPLIMRKRYFLVQGNFSWDDAVVACQTNSAQLATIKLAEDFIFVKDRIDLKSVGYAVWISLKRLIPKGAEFRWIDGTTSFYNGFLPGQPGFDNDCVSYQRNNQGYIGWACVPCDSSVSNVRLPMSALCESFYVL